MISLLRLLRGDLRQRAQRRRFPGAVLHADVVIDSATVLGRHTVLFAGVSLCDTVVGDYSYLQSGTQVVNSEIGAYCSIASEVVIGLIDHPTGMLSTSPVLYDNRQPLPRFLVDSPLHEAIPPRTVIGADTWIGQRAMIKAGVTIGVGAVIGAGALVTRDVPPYTIVVGTPARALRRRFPDELCERLLATRWWLRSDAELSRLRSNFGDPAAFVAALERE